MLDLTFFATGNRQHVFVATGGDDDWVYKIPAAYGYILPYRHRLGTARPITSPKKALHWVLFGLPHRLRKRLLAPVAGYLAGRSRWAASLLAPVHGVARLVRRVRDRIMMAYYRRARARDFGTMLGLLEDLSRHGLGHVTLPYHIIRDGQALLRLPTSVVPYRGPLLAQRRSSACFESEQPLREFAPPELIQALHALWRHGFALTEKGENLGRRSWTLLDGRLYLADTSSLTRELRRARRTLRRQSLDFVERRTLRRFRHEPEHERSLERYFRTIRRDINRETLTRLWRAELRDSAS